jgi:hypothetical protein
MGRLARYARIGSALLFLAFAWAPASSGAAAPGIAPIVGTWSSLGATINVVQTGPNRYAGTVVSGTWGACPGTGNTAGDVVWKGLSGAGFNYSGKVPWVDLGKCSPLGDGPTNWKLTSIDSGAYTGTSPDGTVTETQTMTRTGAWPGAGANGEVSCVKNGLRVLCKGAQQGLVKDQLAQAKRMAKLYSEISKALRAKRRASTPAQQIAAEDALADLVIKTAAIVTGKEKIVLPVPKLDLPSTPDQWKALALPVLKKKAEDKWGDKRLFKLYEFAEEGQETLQLNNKLLLKADRLYATDPATATELDNAAGYGDTGVHFSALSPAEKLKAASKVEHFLGEEHALHNQLSDFGIAGVKVTFSLPRS